MHLSEADPGRARGAEGRGPHALRALRAGARAHAGRVAAARSADVDRGVQRHEVVQLLDVRNRHSDAAVRSEEHTSELQSQSNLVCRLLLEKKNISNESAAGGAGTEIDIEIV